MVQHKILDKALSSCHNWMKSIEGFAKKNEIVKHLSQNFYIKILSLWPSGLGMVPYKFWTSFYTHAKHESIHQRLHKNRHCKNFNTNWLYQFLIIAYLFTFHYKNFKSVTLTLKGWGSYYIKFWTSIYHHIKHETNIPQGLETMRS